MIFACNYYTTRGTAQLSINGANLGPAVDQYNAAEPSLLLISGLLISRRRATTHSNSPSPAKNAASSGYAMAFDDVMLPRKKFRSHKNGVKA
jgi:hypothetical protein